MDTKPQFLERCLNKPVKQLLVDVYLKHVSLDWNTYSGSSCVTGIDLLRMVVVCILN